MHKRSFTAAVPASIPPKPRAVIEWVCRDRRVTFKELLERSMCRRLVAARRDAIVRLRNEIHVAGDPMSFEQIGKLLRLHHSTVLYHFHLAEGAKNGQN
jgi:hypothetical protein